MNDFLLPYYAFIAWVEANPENAYNFYKTSASSMQKRMFAIPLFFAWASNDVKGALLAAQGITSREERSQAFAAIAMKLAESDPLGAFEILIEQEGIEPTSFEGLFGFWAGQDYAAALSKIESLPGGPIRESAFNGFLKGIHSDSIEQIARAVIEFPDPKTRESAMRELIEKWVISGGARRPS